ncbi:DUF4038 domain-containing protein [Actinopolymorpha rutila]|uniref:Apiosidase-like catalytic domain-containing protein n=1 Tax=Actinopolymorpha rutila TaxID=446787 RepID=A0A852Z827_9ACTN|nr:DUF4038 domain-containing protein [Actinopolymorpha rutila]NYH88012.1 hypothetical protein [Actinopolymorpha rutila]
MSDLTGTFPHMSRLTVDPSGTHLRLGEAFFPLIMDTAWSSFADPSAEEWRSYLATRRRQGFTCVAVSVLPILHDRDERAGSREPFALDAEGHPDFDRPDEGFFAQAREFTRIAHEEYDLRLLLVVLWNNYVPGTWAAARTPYAVMADKQRRAYVERVARTFGDLEPVFAVGGDDNYRVPEANAAYREAAAQLRDAAPSCLLTTHSAPHADLPDDLADALDFFCHQSGHDARNVDLTWQQAAGYLARTPRKPLLAAEPAYEQHGRVNGHGRWSRDDVRRASWTSVLAGAAAGIGYGAHGMWMWHSPSARFTSGGASLEPYPWPAALGFPGALDISLMARLFVDHRLYRLAPAQELLGAGEGDGDPGAGEVLRLGASPDRDLLVLYLPYSRDAEVLFDLRHHRLTGWDLAERAPLTVDPVFEGGRTRLRQLPTLSDQLVVAERTA